MNGTTKSKDLNKTERLEKFELIATNTIFGIMILLTITGTGYLGLMLQEYLLDFEKTRPDYKAPKFQDFFFLLISMPVMAVIFS
jgi:hypothetical protein